MSRSKQSADRKNNGIDELEKTCRESEEPLAQVRALYCLLSSEGLTLDTLVDLLQSPDARVRRHALKVCEVVSWQDAMLVEQLREMVGDREPWVRYQLALTLGRFDWDVRRGLLSALLSLRGQISWMTKRNATLMKKCVLLSSWQWGSGVWRCFKPC